MIASYIFKYTKMANPSPSSSDVSLIKDHQPPTPSVQIPDPTPPHQEDHSPKPTTLPPVLSPNTASAPAPAQVQSSSSGSGLPAGSGRHPGYRGIRSRSGKWVSEIREPRKTTRIWLGTYPTPEMAATAYDVAAIALKGPDTDLNFPDRILSYPRVGSTSASDIRAAAASAAATWLLPKQDDKVSSKDSKQDQGKPGDEGTPSMITTTSTCIDHQSGSGQEFIDEEEFLNFPNLVADMAEGMLVSPPSWINSPPSDDSPENSDGESLWTYT